MNVSKFFFQERMMISIYNPIGYKNWTKNIFKIISLTITVVFLFNYSIDPYGKQNIFCSKEFKPVLNERAKKYSDIFYDGKIREYDSLILGSSRVMQIIPSHFEETKTFYNFGVHVANNAEKLFILKEWLKVKKLKKVYFGIDYYNFHKNKRPIYLDPMKFQNNDSSNYLSVSTLKLSYKTLLNQIKNKPQTFFMEDGSINYFNNDRLIKENKYDFSQKRFETEAKNNILEDMVNDPFVIDDNVFEILKEVKELSIKHNFELFVFITPMEQLSIEEIEKHPEIVKKFQYIDSHLVDIFGKVYKFYDKNYYNADTHNFYDLVHYRSLIGDKIIQTFIGTSLDYGQILTKENN